MFWGWPCIRLESHWAENTENSSSKHICIHSHPMVTGNCKEVGGLKSQNFLGKCEAKLRFPEGWAGRLKPQKIICTVCVWWGGEAIDILWNHTFGGEWKYCALTVSMVCLCSISINGLPVPKCHFIILYWHTVLGTKACYLQDVCINIECIFQCSHDLPSIFISV